MMRNNLRENRTQSFIGENLQKKIIETNGPKIREENRIFFVGNKRNNNEVYRRSNPTSQKEMMNIQ